jgi:protein-S-isoprenylcysteine O-methyltransferase Ste14
LKINEWLYKNRNYALIPFFIIGLLLSQPRQDLLIFGLILVGFGEVMRLLGMSYTGSDLSDPVSENSKLVTNGIYAHIRNPIFTGNIFIAIGAIIGLNGWQPYLLWLGLFYFPGIYHLIAHFEEEQLMAAFSDEYEKYFHEVPRFYPRISPYHHRTKVKADFNQALKLEGKMFGSIAVAGIIFALHWYLFAN